MNWRSDSRLHLLTADTRNKSSVCISVGVTTFLGGRVLWLIGRQGQMASEMYRSFSFHFPRGAGPSWVIHLGVLLGDSILGLPTLHC